MVNAIKALYRKDPKRAQRVAKVLGYRIHAELKGANLKKAAQGILRTIKALEQFKSKELLILQKGREGGATTNEVAQLVDSLLEQLQSYEAGQW